MKVFCVLLAAVVACLCGSASSEPTSIAVSVTSLRPYSGSNWVYVGTDFTDGQFCSPAFYSIDISGVAGRAMYAAALTAVASGKQVKLEITACNTGPANSTQLQSLYIVK